MATDPIEELRGYGDDLRAEISSEHARSRVAPMIRPRPRRTVAIALAAAMALVIANLGLAAVADSSVPGDPLYGIDIAYEKVGEALGVGGDTRSERLDEAEILSNRGRAAEAIGLVRQALGDGPQADALAEAQAALTATPDNAAPDTSFDTTLQSLIDAARSQTTETAGEEISELARALRDSVRGGIDPPGPPDGIPTEDSTEEDDGPPVQLPVDPPAGP